MCNYSFIFRNSSEILRRIAHGKFLNPNQELKTYDVCLFEKKMLFSFVSIDNFGSVFLLTFKGINKVFKKKK